MDGYGEQVNRRRFCQIAIVGLGGLAIGGCLEKRVSNSMPIRIKPHHLVDIFVQFGNGEEFVPHPYGHAVHTVAKRVLGDPETLLEMTSGADDICIPCIHYVNGTCDDTIDNSWRPQAPPSKNEWNLRVDKRYYTRLGLQDGDRMTARRFAEIVGNLTLEDFNETLYPELPREWNSQKLDSLQKGVEKYFGQGKGKK